ncbi:hypothetical protein MAR_006535 [Mya arenaria]|uniref:Uncharacterized protein n=1 Tax=Mya arenaria TaxID=6604 RepID=A0ABY7D8R8_MYAAR|nr:hypothetical protein MAR_006535 [Mya arenaria]
MKGVKQVEIEMNKLTSDVFNKQRNEKQLRNIKYNFHKSKKDVSETGNLADQIINVEEMTKSGDFVQSVKHMNALKQPTITLFTDQQITDIKRFCCKGGAVLGMDKTYNLGDFHVTPTVYKDLSVVKRTTQEHPICFGPTYIHTSSTAKTYSSFLHDIAENLAEHEIENLTIGTDEELAMKMQLDAAFPARRMCYAQDI